MSYKIVLIRHGESEWNLKNLFTGWSDPDLSETGHKEAKLGGGIYDYKIKCDEGNNTPESIDRNELHCAIGIKPVKSAEFIMLDFIALSTGGSWSEAGF